MAVPSRRRAITKIVSCAVFLFAGIVLTGCEKTPFEKAHSLAEAKNPRWLSIEITTADGRREYKESEYIEVVVRYSSSVRYQYKADIADSASRAAATDLLHVSESANVPWGTAISCCDSSLIGLDIEPFVRRLPSRFRLKPGEHEMYLTTRRVFLWSAGPKEYFPSTFESASNLLKVNIVPDPGWQERKLADIQQRLAATPGSCGDFSDLDAPSVTAEKLKIIENGTPCGDRVRFQPAEVEYALRGMEQLIRKPGFGILQRDINNILKMKTWLAHPESRPYDTSEEYSRYLQASRALFLEQETELTRQICAILPTKIPKARAITEQTLSGLKVRCP